MTTYDSQQTEGKQMTENRRAREFYIKNAECDPVFDVFESEIAQVKPDLTNPIWEDFKRCVHVIEFSEVARLEKEVAEWKDRHEIVSSTNKLQRMTIGELNKQRDDLQSELKTTTDNAMLAGRLSNERIRELEKQLAGSEATIQELEQKLEFMNQNCISLGLHDSRVQALEHENEKLKQFNEALKKVGV